MLPRHAACHSLTSVVVLRKARAALALASEDGPCPQEPESRFWFRPCVHPCVAAFMRTKTMRKSGYFARVFELRHVSRPHESSRRSSCSSFWRSNSSSGPARYGSRLRPLVPSPGWQMLSFTFMISTSYLLRIVGFEAQCGSPRRH